MHGLSVRCIGLLVLAVSACSLASVCIVEQTYLHCALLDSSTFPQLIVQLAALRTALESDCFLTCALNMATYITHRMVADMLSVKPAICQALFASKRLNYHLVARHI